MKANKAIRALVAVGVAAAVTVPVAAASADSGANRQLAQARAATAQFHNVDTARAAGYLPDEHCVEVPGLGAMGFHNPNLGLMDLAVDHRTPELLLYAPKKNGGTRLVAVEYFVPFVGQPAPELFGQRFDGPMPGHGPGMPTHYDLHVWLWKHNPAGMFAPFNSKVSCTP
jgi:hypothetical protein